MAQQIRSLGGHVLASYQAAYNGFKVQIAANQAAQLASLPGVTGVYPLPTYKLDNTHGIPLVGGPQVWDAVNGNFHGEGIKIADIDTGIDYTHADFGGPGNPARTTRPRRSPRPTHVDVGCMTPSDAVLRPARAEGQGRHRPRRRRLQRRPALVLLPAGPASRPEPARLQQPRDAHGRDDRGLRRPLRRLDVHAGRTTRTRSRSNSWNVGPGMAPKADLYSVKIFGCSNSTNDVIDGIEWAVDHNMDVINMSLGSPFGATDSPDAVAASNAAKDGVIVVASSGNEGPNPYMTGDPASGSGVISVAASDPTQTFPAANLTLTNADSSSGGTLTAINANGFTPPPGRPVQHRGHPGDRQRRGARRLDSISFGCSAADDGAVPANTFIVVERGGCARVAKAIFGQQAGAAGVIMVNYSAGFPPFEGPITGDPDPTGPPLFGGFAYTVTIPFLGVPGGDIPSESAAGAALIAADGGTLTESAATSANPGFEALARLQLVGAGDRHRAT